MPLNHLELQEQITCFSRESLRYHQNAQEQLAQALQALAHFSSDLGKMQRIGNVATVRVAIPTGENPATSFSVLTETNTCNLVCADGSQIIPDPHTVPVFALVNIGVIRILAGQSEPIQPLIYSKLLQHDQLYVNNELVNEEMVNLERDMLEMRHLSENCRGLKGPVIALRDGMLELYHEPRNQQAFQEKVQSYHAYLESLHAADVIGAGYVDKPRSQMVLELLRLCAAEDQKQSAAAFFPNLIDRQLFEQRLKSGERSAIFENRPCRDNPAERFSSKFFFFYFNVSCNEKPWIVRVEIPDWVAADSAKVNLLQSVLLEQCAIMGTKPYPYCLHRAHETALVRQEEKDELGKRIQTHQLQDGIPLDEKSYKQSAKDHEPRKTVERKR
jgi:hypothetical protein